MDERICVNSKRTGLEWMAGSLKFRKIPSRQFRFRARGRGHGLGYAGVRRIREKAKSR
jgi:hypothetical protein